MKASFISIMKSNKPKNKIFLNLLNLTSRLSKTFKEKPLDIEFAIDNKKQNLFTSSQIINCKKKKL